jgi:hypothetical protein
MSENRKIAQFQGRRRSVFLSIADAALIDVSIFYELKLRY